MDYSNRNDDVSTDPQVVLDRIEQEELDKLIAAHELWLDTVENSPKSRGWVEIQGERLDLRSKDLKGLDFSYKKLESAFFIKCDVANCNFTNSNLNYSRFHDTNLDNTSFAKADLKYSELRKNSGESTNFYLANFYDAFISDNKFIRSNFGETNFRHANLYNNTLDNSDFHRTVIDKEQLETCSKVNVNLESIETDNFVIIEDGNKMIIATERTTEMFEPSSKDLKKYNTYDEAREAINKVIESRPEVILTSIVNGEGEYIEDNNYMKSLRNNEKNALPRDRYTPFDNNELARLAATGVIQSKKIYKIYNKDAGSQTIDDVLEDIVKEPAQEEVTETTKQILKKLERNEEYTSKFDLEFNKEFEQYKKIKLEEIINTTQEEIARSVIALKEYRIFNSSTGETLHMPWNKDTGLKIIPFTEEIKKETLELSLNKIEKSYSSSDLHNNNLTLHIGIVNTNNILNRKVLMTKEANIDVHQTSLREGEAACVTGDYYNMYGQDINRVFPVQRDLLKELQDKLKYNRESDPFGEGEPVEEELEIVMEYADLSRCEDFLKRINNELDHDLKIPDGYRNEDFVEPGEIVIKRNDTTPRELYEISNGYLDRLIEELDRNLEQNKDFEEKQNKIVEKLKSMDLGR